MLSVLGLVLACSGDVSGQGKPLDRYAARDVESVPVASGIAVRAARSAARDARGQVRGSGGVPQSGAPQLASFAGLTASDYLEIRQLVARYAYAVDTGADDGRIYAGLFAPDGAFADRMGRETKGPEALAGLARRNARGPQSAFHFIVNHVIEPAPDGATGREYLLQLRIGDGERPNGVFGGGTYHDVYVRTPEGWRFKRRQFIPSEGSPAPRRGAEAR